MFVKFCRELSKNIFKYSEVLVQELLNNKFSLLRYFVGHLAHAHEIGQNIIDTSAGKQLQSSWSKGISETNLKL